MRGGSGAYRCQLHGCNLANGLGGVFWAALIGSQFTALHLPNYTNVDVRSLGVFHLVSAAVGTYALCTRRGGVLAKCVYLAAASIALFTALFYAQLFFTVIRCF